MKVYSYLTVILLFFAVISGCTSSKNLASGYSGGDVEKLGPTSYLVTSSAGLKRKIRSYGNGMIRLQTISASDDFLPDNHYEMIVDHQWQPPLTFSESEQLFVFTTDAIKLEIQKDNLIASFSHLDNGIRVLQESEVLSRQDRLLKTQFVSDSRENFTGLGHGYYARADSINLKGQVIERNYGSKPIEQAPLIVPFYLSGKGYGVFLNSMHQNRFAFSADGEYSIGFDDYGFGGQMDYVFIAGPTLANVLDNYTQLTGRPRLPMKSMFGLQLSDKGHDHNSDTPSDQQWWQAKIEEHRAANLPLDHVVNDNRWRAAGGKRCESKIAWDNERYPSPQDYKKWLDDNGLVITLDFNRCIAKFSDGWSAEFNLPQIEEIEFRDSAPDLTNPQFRKWFWQVFYDNALNPALNFPGDALWIDEFDEQGAAPKSILLANGRSSAEMRNYWFFLISKALVEQGWDVSGMKNRPFVWVRGMTAGAQRYATLWSGDIYPNYKEMKGQIRGMQLAGMSGFPFWGHDAGGFFDWNNGVGPDNNLYQQWSMAFGSFAPIWKPHGMGESRWPLDRSVSVMATVNKYARLRYELMPYTYTAAHQAASSGIPITRPMILSHQHHPKAWQYDLQYMWGDQMLIAPNPSDKSSLDIWLPPGDWYRYRQSTAIAGESVVDESLRIGEMPIFVKAGSIIPHRDYALSTAFIDKTKLRLDVYLGNSGEYTLIEDDDKSEAWQQKGQLQTTKMQLNKNNSKLIILGANGQYHNAPEARRYEIAFYGEKRPGEMVINDVKYAASTEGEATIFSIPAMAITENVEMHLNY